MKEPLNAIETTLTYGKLTKEQYKSSTEKLKKLNKIEYEMNRRASTLNNLESYVIDMQTKLSEDEYSEAATAEETKKILDACSEVSDWLYEDGMDADADTYEAKLDNIKSITNDMMTRVFEHKERPEALNALNSMLNSSRHFLDNAKNLTKTSNPEKDVFTDIEIEALEKLILETEEWRDKKIEEQNKLKKYETVKLTVKSLVDHMQALDREMKYLVNKLKIWRPRKPVEEKKDENKTTEEDKTKNEKAEEKVEEEKEEEIKMEPENQEEAPEKILELGEAAEGSDEKVEPTKAKDDDHSEL